MNGVLTNRGVYVGSIIFLLFTAIVIYMELWYALMLPYFLAMILFVFFKPRYLLFAIVFLTPLSLNLEEIGIGTISFYLPTEPLLFGLTIILLLAHIYRPVFPTEVVQHPISRALYIYLGWMFITSLTSVDPMVSIKFLISRLWFIVPLYFAGATMFLKRGEAHRFLILYLVPFIGVVIYTLFRHSALGFEEGFAHSVMEPFYRDHTQYGAVIAFFTPIAFGFFIEKNRDASWRLFSGIALFILSFALVFTYARAAWLSVFLVLFIWFLVLFRVKLWIIFGTGLMSALIVLISFNEIMMTLQKNKTDSSENLVENVESITNISTDASNLERINRWNSVFAMAREKPIFGFGPGMYMFEYAPYQRSQDLTIISTNFGDVGNAHSEYLGPLAETGIPGMLTVLFWVGCLFRTAFFTYRRLPPGRDKHLLLFVTLALITYFTHGLLNNYLDSDKASIPVFGAMAIVTAIDILSQKSRADLVGPSSEI